MSDFPLLRQHTKNIPGTPPQSKKRERPETPGTILKDEHGNDVPNPKLEKQHKKFDEWQRDNKKYKMVPFLEKLFDKDGNIFYEPSQENMKFILVQMTIQDIQLGKQAYNFEGKIKDSNKISLEKEGGNKRKTSRKRRSSKRKHKKSIKKHK